MTNVRSTRTRKCVWMLFASLILSATQICSAQPTPIQPSRAPAESTPLSPNDAKISLLEKEIDISKQYQDRILSTVYWSLSSLLTIGVILVGSNWFFNWRIAKNERDAFRAEMYAEIQKVLMDQITQLREHQLAEREATLKELTVSSKQHALSVKATIDGRISSIQDELVGLLSRTSNEDGEMWIKEKVYSNALRSFAEVVRQVDGTTWSWRIPAALDSISACLAKCIAEKYRIAADDIQEMEALTMKIQKDHGIVCAKIRTLLQQV